jgi:hypothetical protein
MFSESTTDFKTERLDDLIANVPALNEGCQMVNFVTKNPNLGKFWKALDWKMFIYFKVIWNILRTFGIFYDYSE